ncbi:MAG TPA: hypothetical protein VLA04_02825, partial [Verrucomicrobiae bacterium]|nr:hypothetical protein [Verrucomicrobiae bacterium]
MKRTTVLTSLGSISLSVILAFSAWVGLAFMRSKPVSTDRVLGASSSEVSVTPTPLPYPVRSEAKAPTIQARRYALYNPDSGKLLEGKDANLQVPIASTTKLMTTYVIARMGQTSDEIVVSREAAFQIGSLMNLRPGEKITIDSLLKGALLVSGNDAAMALAEYGGGRLLANPSAPREERVARFVEEMN